MKGIFFVLTALVFTTSQSTTRTWVDRLEQLYVLSGETLTKYDPQGNALFSTSFNATGAPSELDVTNPLMPVLFYQNTGNLVVLDNTLSKQHDGFDLFAETGRNVGAFCNATGGWFWLFDESRFELVRVDQQLRELDATGPLFSIAHGLTSPDQMRVEGNRLYLLVRGKGIWVFDQFGTYLHRLPLDGVEGMGFSEGKLLYHTHNQVFESNRLAAEDPIRYRCSEGEKVLSVEGKSLVLSLGERWLRKPLPPAP